MIYILWSVLNAALLVYFFYLLIGFIVNGRDVFLGKFRPVSIVVITLGVIQIGTAGIPEKKKDEILLLKDYNQENPVGFKSMVLEENSAFDILLTVTYYENDGELILIKSNSHLIGSILGFEWNFYNFNTIKTLEKNTSDYIVDGGLEWHLFGFHIFTQDKQFTGKLKIL